MTVAERTKVPLISSALNKFLYTDEELIESKPYSENGQKDFDSLGHPLYVSEETYWAEYYEHEINYEWNNGILEEKSVASLSQYRMYRWFLKILESYLEVTENAEILALETGFLLSLANRNAVRKPDIGVVRRDNPIPIQADLRHYPGIFDLCVESLSDSSKKEVSRDTVDKLGEYQHVGVREYYILDDRPNRHAEFYHMNASGIYVPIPRIHGGDVIQSIVLPGFQFRISDLYQQPHL
ncbi:MAG: Uma2 family endonuclease [Chloroflexota bacterium]